MVSTPQLPARPASTELTAPSLLPAFAAERGGLERALSTSGETALSSAQTVSAIRGALDRTGAAFARSRKILLCKKLGSGSSKSLNLAQGF